MRRITKQFIIQTRTQLKLKEDALRSLFGGREGAIGEVETISGKADCVVSLSMGQCSECVCYLFHLITYQSAYWGRFYLFIPILQVRKEAQRLGAV